MTVTTEEIHKINHIYNQFRTEGRFRNAKRFGSGHIHQTWLIDTKEEQHPGYILQEFNKQVFPQTDKVMENILRVTQHLRQHSEHGKIYNVAEPVAANSGEYYYTDDQNNDWRLFHRITPGISFDTVPDETVAYEAAKIYGSFIAGLSNFPAETLHEVIPGFHSVELRYRQLMDVIEADAAGRVSDVDEEIRFAKEQVGAMRKIPELSESSPLPVRVTHNDTKLNNILFDEKNRAAAVVDLDTVMPGYLLYDFGDLVRSAANRAGEDDKHAAFSLPLFHAIAKGFLEETAVLLTDEERSLLALSPQYMAYLMGIRFLADYLNGDTYYTTHYHGQNLNRCRAQFGLMKSMGDVFDECEAVIKGI